MFDNLTLNPNDLMRYGPEILLTIAGTIIMVLEGIAGRAGHSKIAGYLALVALFASMGLSIQAGYNQGPAFQNMVTVDGFATFFRVLVSIVAILVVLCSFSYLRREEQESGEYYALLLFSVVGQYVMVSANELIMIFIGLEISSIATYILSGFLHGNQRNSESAIKYFLLGSFATAFLLYGIAWTYGLTGTTNLAEIHNQVARVLSGNNEFGNSSVLIGTAAALMFVGFAFKISAAPFQIWAPDVYQGAPAPVTAFMAAAPKAAAFAIFLRVYLTAFDAIASRWEPLVWGSALLTMVIGNFAALTQNNIKRLLAYSSIAHAGYILVALRAHSEIAVSAVLFYLTSYAFMNVGAFAVVSHFSQKNERYVQVEDFAGLGQRQPAMAALLTIFLLSLIGVPLTGGFFAKFYLFKAALDAKLFWLTILGLLNSAVAAYYYLRVILVMYTQEPGAAANEVTPLSPGVTAAVWGSAAATILLGIFPTFVLDLARKSAVLVK